tara:strand:- start:761 stop:1963 length:1203 start_codon:yes stop_codon:yes gene_type:complete
MKIIFLTLVKIQNIEERGIYSDLLRKFRDEGHDVFIVSPLERRYKKPTVLINKGKVKLLNVKTFNVQKVNVIEKGLGTLAIEYQYLNAIKKHFSTVIFDLILYSTPPITFSRVISYIKKRDGAYSYLLLKDIFPQNAVDMKILRNGGLLHKMFLKKEQRLYQLSDTIGCMSEANMNYILEHNTNIKLKKVEVNPNSIAPIEFTQTAKEKQRIKNKYGLPLRKKILVYGGNLGRPQGIDFLIQTITETINEEFFFLIVGSGTEYNYLANWFSRIQPVNAILLKGLPKSEYDQLLLACDAGLIFLQKNFTIPNFPSRLLAYLECKMPVIAATDAITDIGSILEKNKCGYRVIAGDQKSMQFSISNLFSSVQKFNKMKENAWQLLQKEYTVNISYNLIINKIM